MTKRTPHNTLNHRDFALSCFLRASALLLSKATTDLACHITAHSTLDHRLWAPRLLTILIILPTTIVAVQAWCLRNLVLHCAISAIYSWYCDGALGNNHSG